MEVARGRQIDDDGIDMAMMRGTADGVDVEVARKTDLDHRRGSDTDRTMTIVSVGQMRASEAGLESLRDRQHTKAGTPTATKKEQDRLNTAIVDLRDLLYDEIVIATDGLRSESRLETTKRRMKMLQPSWRR